MTPSNVGENPTAASRRQVKTLDQDTLPRWEKAVPKPVRLLNEILRPEMGLHFLRAWSEMSLRPATEDWLLPRSLGACQP